MGNEDRRYDRQRCELMEAIRYNEMGKDGKPYDIQKLESKSGDTIYRDWNIWHAIR